MQGGCTIRSPTSRAGEPLQLRPHQRLMLSVPMTSAVQIAAVMSCCCDLGVPNGTPVGILSRASLLSAYLFAEVSVYIIGPYFNQIVCFLIVEF